MLPHPARRLFDNQAVCCRCCCAAQQAQGRQTQRRETPAPPHGSRVTGLLLCAHAYHIHCVCLMPVGRCCCAPVCRCVLRGPPR
jgi:hypothetical protein